MTSVIKKISEYFGELSISRGNKHDFLGMDVEIKNKKVYITMKKQIEEAISWYDDHIGGSATTPATKVLFNVNDDSILLESEKADIFHSIVAKLLYICKRARPDIEPAVSFLCTRVSCPDGDDWIKLARVLNFLRKTINDVRIFGATSLDTLWTWVDAAYAVHPDMKGHTGGVMSLGHGVVHSRSSKQKINTKSSTESELVGVSEYLPFHIWMINFLEYQGYTFKNKILFQDNQSAMKMETNGRNSCTGNSRHIDIRYFFVKDRVDSGKIKIMYCPTELMLADFFTKVLQGSLFNLFRNAIMGYTPMSDIMYDDAKIKECVGNTKNERSVIFNNNNNINKNKRMESVSEEIKIERATTAKKVFNQKRKENVFMKKRNNVRNEKSEANKKRDGKVRANERESRNVQKKRNYPEKINDVPFIKCTNVEEKINYPEKINDVPFIKCTGDAKNERTGSGSHPKKNKSKAKAKKNDCTKRTYRNQEERGNGAVSWADVVKRDLTSSLI